MKTFALALVGGGWLILATAGGALADQAAAMSCATGLAPNARMIYDASLPKVKPGVVLKDVLRGAARPLVMSGKINRGEAPAAAEAAGKCLQLLS